MSELSAILDFGGYACDIEQLVIMSPKSYTSVTIWNKKLSDDFSNKT